MSGVVCFLFVWWIFNVQRAQETAENRRFVPLPKFSEQVQHFPTQKETYQTISKNIRFPKTKFQKFSNFEKSTKYKISKKNIFQIINDFFDFHNLHIFQIFQEIKENQNFENSHQKLFWGIDELQATEADMHHLSGHCHIQCNIDINIHMAICM